jgi:hypothetical protein
MRILLLPVGLLCCLSPACADDGPAGNFGGLHYGWVQQDLDALKNSTTGLEGLDDRPWQAGMHIFTSQGGTILGFKGDLGWNKLSGTHQDVRRFESDLFVHFGRALEAGSLYHAWFSGGVGWMGERLTLREQPGRDHWNEAFDGSYTTSVLGLSGPAWELLLGTDIRTRIPNMDTGAWLTMGLLLSYKQHFSRDLWTLNGSEELRGAPTADVGGPSLLLTLGWRY